MSEDLWEVADLKYKDCRVRISIKKDSKYRNTYCCNCRTAHMWERVDPTEFNKRGIQDD